MIVDYKLSMRRGSLLFQLWEKPPLDVYISVYMFNVTNWDRFEKGLDEKLKVEEVGPYVYQEFLENSNATFNENGTLTFRPHRRVEFVPERSVGDPKVDKIIAPNVPYMGVTTAASDISIFAAIAVRTLMRNFNAKIMLEISVHDYLWGYEDHLVNIASKLIPSVISFEKFGLLDRMFDEGKNLVTINIPNGKKPQAPLVDSNAPVSERLTMDDNDYYESYSSYEPAIRDFSIDNWNGNKGLSNWGYHQGGRTNTECNTLQGTFDGTLFPRNISKGETFRIYRKAFCRALPIIYSHPGVVDGVDAYFFKLADNAFDSDLSDPQSSCFCKRNTCLKKGLGNITPCYYNIPTAVSFPHFYNADPSLLEHIDGLSPNKEKHGSEIVIQPQLGVPMKVHTRFQLNLLMGDIKFNSDMAKFENTVLPILWLEIGIESLTPDLILLLQVLFNVAPYLQLGFIILVVAGGVAFLAFASLILFCNSNAPRVIEPIIREFDPKLDIRRYSEMYIFPLIKREICRFDEDQHFLAAQADVEAEAEAGESMS